MSKSSRLVYSTDIGRIKDTEPERTEDVPSDGIVRIRRETKGRGGKCVCVIEGIRSTQLKPISKKLKSQCATGGVVKEQRIEIQGDHRERLKTLLEKDGFTVKLSGG